MCFAIFLGSFMNSLDFLAHTLGFVLQVALPCSPHGRSPQRYFLLANEAKTAAVEGSSLLGCPLGVCRSLAAIAMKIALFRGQLGCQSV